MLAFCTCVGDRRASGELCMALGVMVQETWLSMQRQGAVPRHWHCQHSGLETCEPNMGSFVGTGES